MDQLTPHIDKDESSALLRHGEGLNKPDIYELHNQAVAVVGTLFEKQDAIDRFGINGSIVGVVELPVESPEDQAKRIAIVDYGEFDDGSGPALLIVEGKEMPFFGKAETRFGLQGINYSDNMRLPFLALQEGDTELGRDKQNRYGRSLALTEDTKGDKSISRSHFTVHLNGRGEITVSDHSTNGTKVEIANLTEVARQSAGEVAGRLVTRQEVPTPSLISEVPRTGAEAVHSLEQYQAQKATEAEERLRKVEAGVEAEIDQLEEGLTEDDKLNMSRFVRATNDKRHAQLGGNEVMSSQYGMDVSNAFNSLSPTAKDRASRYLQLFDHLDLIRK